MIKYGRTIPLFFEMLIVFLTVISGNSIISDIISQHGTFGKDRYIICAKDEKHRLLINDLKELRIMLNQNTYSFSGWSEEIVYTSSNNSALVKLTATNEHYPLFHTMSINGSFISDSSFPSGNAIVIPEQLAWELFRSADVLGMDVKIGDNTLRIAGIYKKPETLFNTILSDIPKIFISADGYKKINPTVYISEMEVHAENYTDLVTALKNIGKNPNDYDIINCALEYDYMKQSLNIFLFFLGCLIIRELFVISITLVKSAGIMIRKQMQTEYFKTVIKNSFKHCGIIFIKILLLCLISVFVINMVKFELLIHPSVIPEELIDLSFYKDLLISKTRESLFETAHFIPDWSLGRECISKTVIFITALSCFFILVNYNRKIKQWASIQCVLACLVISFLLAASITYLVRIPVAIDYKSITIVYLFYCIRICKAYYW